MGKQLRLKPSKIHGIGVFANEYIAKGERISSMRGAPVGKREQFDSLPITGLVINDVVFGITEGFPLWYVNYSNEPNIEVEGFNVMAIRSIASGDELTLKEYDATSAH